MLKNKTKYIIKILKESGGLIWYVIVETDICNGLPSFDMVGLLASNIKESRERVRTAIKNSGFMIPPKRITINFSPANIRKTGTYFDQPVAVSILPDMTLEEQIEISKI